MIREREESSLVRAHNDVLDAFPPGLTSTSDFDGTPYAGTALMQQQGWLWERDSQKIGSNLLVDYGFRRSTPPQQEWGARCYEYDLEKGGRIRLWSFGVMYCDERNGAVLLPRPTYAPRLLGPKHGAAPAWEPQHLPTSRVPRLPGDTKKLVNLLPSLFAWIGSYEQWVLDTLGLAYRNECVGSWSAAVCDAAKLPSEWWLLAAKWREHLAR